MKTSQHKKSDNVLGKVYEKDNFRKLLKYVENSEFVQF